MREMYNELYQKLYVSVNVPRVIFFAKKNIVVEKYNICKVIFVIHMPTKKTHFGASSHKGIL